MVGSYVSQTLYSSPQQAIQNLALPPGNTAENVCAVEIPQGTQMQTGTTAPNFGQPGGDPQGQLLQRIPPSSYQPLGPTETAEPVSTAPDLPPAEGGGGGGGLINPFQPENNPLKPPSVVE